MASKKGRAEAGGLRHLRASTAALPGRAVLKPGRRDRAVLNSAQAHRLPAHPLRPADEELISAWGLELRSRGWSVTSADRAMKRLRTFARRAPRKFLDVTKEDLVAFAIDRARVMAERQGRPGGQQSLVPLLKSRGWALFVKDTRDFYGWLERQGLIEGSQNPVRGLHVLPSRPRRVPAQILRHARHYDTLLHHPALNVRERVVMTLLAHGLTPSQTASLQVADVALDTDPVQVRIKSRWHTRVSPVSDRAVDLIRPWVTVRRQWGHPWVLPNGRGGHISPRGVRAVVYRATARVFCHALQRRIRQTISPAGFREVFIVRALKSGVSVDILMALIGLSARRLRPYLAQTAPQERLHTEFRRIIRRWRNWL